MLRILDHENTILTRFLAELRDQEIQKDSMRFRLNLERIGELMAYEISKTLDYECRNIVTPLGEAASMLHTNKIVLASILRAGIPMHQGMLKIYDKAENAFVSAFRKYSKDGTMKIVMEQITTPSLDDKTLILIDPMLATGASIEIAYNALLEKGGTPRHTHIVAAIASVDGVEYVQRHLSAHNVTIWTISVDSDLTVKSYIVPGIGDTGDLAFGQKI